MDLSSRAAIAVNAPRMASSGCALLAVPVRPTEVTTTTTTMGTTEIIKGRDRKRRESSER